MAEPGSWIDGIGVCRLRKSPIRERAVLPGGFGLFRNDIVLDDRQHFTEALSVKLELRDIVLNAQCNLIDLDEECELTLSQGIEQFGFIMRDRKDRLSVGYQFDLGEMVIHVAGATEIVPCPSNPLDRESVVQETFDDTQTDKVAKTVDASPTRATVRGLYRRFHQSDFVPVSKLVWRARCQLARLCGGESLQNKTPL